MKFTFWQTSIDNRAYVKIYTHGSAYLNGQPGAVANSTIHFGRNPKHNKNNLCVPGAQTSQRAALFAAICALDVVKDVRHSDHLSIEKVVIITNCDYPGQVWARGWDLTKRPLPNEDLVSDLLEHKRNFTEVH